MVIVSRVAAEVKRRARQGGLWSGIKGWSCNN